MVEREAKAGPAFWPDRDRVQAQWLRGLPVEVRRQWLRPREIGRLLERVEEVLNTEGPEALLEFKEEAYRLARILEEQVGHQAALRYLRDGLAAALVPGLAARPACAERVVRLLARVTDATWEAHTDALEQAIQMQYLERLRQELLVAKRIQERLLPRSIPQVPGFEIAGKVHPAAEVGGDYWSCKSYPEDGIVTLKLADVTGHGIAAATLVAAVKFISGGYYRGSRSAAEVMERTNHVLVKETPHEILVTMIYGWLYPHDAKLRIVNAGHSPVWHSHEGRLHRVPTTGAALGMIETRYSEVWLDLQPGDFFFTCSDGVTDPCADGLGEAWVERQLVAGASMHAGELVEEILGQALRVYGTPQDDMSLLAVKCTG